MRKKKEKSKRSLGRKIFNGIIGFFAVIILLFVLLIGFSQTYSFREMLRKKITAEFNLNTGGRLSIGKIEGTLLTTLTVRNLSITVDNDTLLSAEKINLFLSPLQILLNRVYIRDFQCSNMKLALLQDSTGQWNFTKLSKQKDTTKSESFIESFQVNNIDIKNLHFIRKSYENLKTDTKYDLINFKDLDIDKININASASGSIKENDYVLKLNNFSLQPNLKKFTVNRVSGEFAINTKSMAVKNFRIETDSTDINLTARLDSVNIFKGITLEDFKNYPAQVQLDVKSFWFDDLSSFIQATDILKGRPSLKLVADGKFGAINVRELHLKYRNTEFNIRGRLLRLNTPESMYIDAQIQKGEVNYNDVLYLLPKFSLPVFKDLAAKNIDITFKGEPTRFNSKFYSEIDGGIINADAYLNVKAPKIEYNIKLVTDKLNFKPATGFDTEINSVSTLEGKGVRPEDLESKFSSEISNSKVQNNVVHDFKITANGSAGNIMLNFNTAINNLKGTLSGSFDFTQPEIPKYNIAGKFNSFNLYQFTADSTLDSRLNFGIFAQGEKFNLDSLKSDITVNLETSSFNDRPIPTSQLRLVVDTENETKKIDLISPFVDFTFTGKFSLKKAIDLIRYEASTITKVIADKASELNPLSVVQNAGASVKEEITIPDIVQYDLNIDYVFFFKDLDPFAQLFNAKRLDLYGKGKGSIKNDKYNFSLSVNLQVDNFVKMNGGPSPIYISGLEGDFKFSRNNNTLSFDNLFGAVSISTDRFYYFNDYKNLNADLTFNQSKLFFNTSSEIDSLWNAEFEGKASFSAQAQEIEFDRAVVTNQGIEWKNSAPFFLSFAADHFQLNGLSLVNKNSAINITGQIFNIGDVNGDIKLTNISLKEFNKMFPKANNPFNGNVNIDAKIRGTMGEPLIDASININGLGIKNQKTGNLFCNINYAAKDFKTSLVLLDSLNNNKDPLLSLNGSVPYDLSFRNIEKRMVEEKEINLVLKSKRFDISNLGDLLPLVVEQQGILESDLKITGTVNQPVYAGFFRVKQGKVTGRLNNMNYNCGLRVDFNGSDIKVDSLLVQNTPDSKYIGTMRGTGSVVMKGLDIYKMDINMNGDLDVYSERSRAVTPFFYGDLFVATDGGLQFNLNNGNAMLTGKLLLKETNLIFTTGQDASSVSNSNDIKFIYLSDPSKTDDKEAEFRKIFDYQNGSKSSNSTQSKFGYNISVTTQNDANIVIVFSNLADRKLTIRSTGSLTFKSDSGTQGQLILLSGSNLDFIKSFQATGKVFFENLISNPNLDIIATYSSDYTPPGTDKPLKYVVKMNLKGTIDQLSVNMAKDKGKFEIYNDLGIQGEQKIQGADDNDVISFILTGKFKNDLTQTDKTDLATKLGSNVTTSLLGSLLTNFLNSAVGDLVQSFSIDPDHPDRLSLSGRYKNLEYRFGASTNALQDFRYMDLELQYPIFSNVWARYERKDPILKTSVLEKKIDEIAFKLRFFF